MASSTKTQRWLDLVAFLAGRRMPVAVEEIMERVPAYAEDWADADDTGRASVRRKFERDKDELRALGIPIETVEYSINYGREQARGYRLRGRDFYLPYLRLVAEEEGGPGARPVGEAGASGVPAFELREEEARAAVEALRRVADLPSFPYVREARSALRKLTFDLDPDLLPRAGPGVLRYLDPPGVGGSDEVRERLRILADALMRKKEVEFGYYAIHRDAESERRVCPWGLLFQRSWWYLIGHDRGREGMRVFRVGRMKDVRVNPKRPRTPDYEIPDDFAMETWAGRPPWDLPGQDDGPLDVTVRFDFPRSLWAERNRYGEGVRTLEDGAQVRGFRVRDTGPFLRWLLTLGGEARVESPGSLEAERRALVRRVAELHGGDPGESGAGPEEGGGGGGAEDVDGSLEAADG